jgi:hypothetical protein
VLEDAVQRMRDAERRAPELAPAIDALEAAIRDRRLALAADDPDLTPMAVPVPRTRANAS